MELELAEINYALYIRGERFVCLFKTDTGAKKFAEKYYSKVETHIEPSFVFTFKR